MEQSAVEDKLHDLGRGVLSQAQCDQVIDSVALLKQGQFTPLLACLAPNLAAATTFHHLARPTTAG
jgi:hypothetical protein